MEDENTMVPETGTIDHTGPEWYQMEIPLDEIGRYIHTDLKTAARSVISIGYWLMYVRDRNQFQEYGYSDINEYAARQFGFSRSTTKRYIDRCIRFSKGGNSPILDDRYRDFSKAQLQEMLGLDDEQLEQVTPDMTVRQIRAMKQPKEILYVELPGQISITDFPGIEPEAAPDVTDVPPEPESVRQIRAMKQPKEILYVELPGQISITDFPGIEPEAAPDVTDVPPEPERTSVQSCEISVEDLMPEVEPLPVESVASETRPEEPEKENSEKMDYTTRKSYCNAFARFLIGHFRDWFREDYKNRVMLVTESEKQLKQRFKETWYFNDPAQDGTAHINLFSDYIQIWDGTGKCLGNTEWFYLCASIQSMWNVIALEDAANMQQNEEICCENGSGEETGKCLGNTEWFYLCASIQSMWNVIALEDAANMQQNEEICCENGSGEESESVATSQPEEDTELTDLELLREMLEKEKALLDEMVKVNAVEELPPKLLWKKKILVAALAGMLCDLEMPEPEEPEQPELPLMKNNDQRKAWLRDYRSWGLWYADEHIGARYYKYDFDNGARLIAEVYTNHNEFIGQDYESSYLHLVGGPEPEKHPSGAYGRWQRHETYSRYPDSETELVEFLKTLQKK